MDLRTRCRGVPRDDKWCARAAVLRGLSALLGPERHADGLCREVGLGPSGKPDTNRDPRGPR